MIKAYKFLGESATIMPSEGTRPLEVASAGDAENTRIMGQLILSRNQRTITLTQPRLKTTASKRARPYAIGRCSEEAGSKTRKFRKSLSIFE